MQGYLVAKRARRCCKSGATTKRGIADSIYTWSAWFIVLMAKATGGGMSDKLRNEFFFSHMIRNITFRMYGRIVYPITRPILALDTVERVHLFGRGHA